LFGEAPQLQAPKRIEVKIDGAPSAEDIARLFEQRTDETDWADVGFKIKDSDIPIWLTKYVVKSTLPIDSDGFSHYSPERLLAEIKAVRSDIIRSVINQEYEAEAAPEIAPQNDILDDIDQVVGD